ncbi:Gfo/Idh/MocA family oxidoreductase [bacterium]|nr:Gfo/Idh/MocA family oxidoreductase [bacterium]
MIGTGVIGYGYWGPNVVRNLNAHPEIDLAVIVDKDPGRLHLAGQSYPHVRVSENADEVFNNGDIDLVCITTPVFSHFGLAKQALEKGKHIFIEKPFTSTVEEAEILIGIAHKNQCLIMVDHTFLFTGAVRKIKSLVDDGTLGELLYYDSVRVNLGLFQHDVNVIWDLAPHDISIMDYILNGKSPCAVSAFGAGHFGRHLQDVAYLTLQFDNNFIAHFNVNWLSPVKVRRTLLAGDRKMLVWDDLKADEKVKIYDTGVQVQTKEGAYEAMVDYRIGDMLAPVLDRTEALKKEIGYLVQCIRDKETPVNDGRAGLRVVQILELSNRSIQQNGMLIDFETGGKV